MMQFFCLCIAGSILFEHLFCVSKYPAHLPVEDIAIAFFFFFFKRISRHGVLCWLGLDCSCINNTVELALKNVNMRGGIFKMAWIIARWKDPVRYRHLIPSHLMTTRSSMLASRYACETCKQGLYNNEKYRSHSQILSAEYLI